jgi:hypothetical protein
MAMTDAQHAKVRDLLELVSRTVETNPDATAPTVRMRAKLSRRTGDKALELLLRSGFLERRRVDAQDTYRSVRPYRVSNEAPRAAYGDTHGR